MAHSATHMKSSILHGIALAIIFTPGLHAQSFLEKLGFGKSSPKPEAARGADLTTDEITQGLKAALAQGVEHAVGSLGKEDGFLKDLKVKVPMPETLRKIERTLRAVGQEKAADEFVTTMNRAAERAVPEAAGILGSAVSQMSLADARLILTSTNNAATSYFRRTAETNLQTRFLPIVRQATERAGVTSAYKKLVEKASFGGFSASSVLGSDATDLDGYITRKTLDGLFLKIGDEERQIRENPVARTTSLLQKVFGGIPGVATNAPAKSP